jgi:hypothetical protein
MLVYHRQLRQDCSAMTAQVPETITINGEHRLLCAFPLAPLFHSWPSEPRFWAATSANWRGYRGSWESTGGKLYLTGFAATLEPEEDRRVSLPWRSKEDNDLIWGDQTVHPSKSSKNEIASVLARQAAERWKDTIRQLGALSIDESGYSVAPRFRSPVSDDDGFLSKEYAGNVDLKTVLNTTRSPIFASWYTGLLRIPDGKMINYVHGGFGSMFEPDLIFSIESGNITKQWTLNYVPAFFDEHAEEATATYSLVAMKPHLKLDANAHASRFLASPFSWDRAKAVSAVFAEEPPSLFLFRLSDLVDVVLRADLLQAAGSTPILSDKDRLARCKFEEMISTFKQSVHEAEYFILKKYFRIECFSAEQTNRGKEMFHALQVPDDFGSALNWAVSVTRETSKHLSEGRLVQLGIACQLVEEALRSDRKV